jgi:DNA-binding transcriptional LysR family regulator
MKNLPLSDLELFSLVAQHQSFRKAAEERGISVSLLSQTVRRLEDRLGVRLLHRTTRSVAATEAGRELLNSLGPALAQINDALVSVNRFSDAPTGVLRLNAPAPVAHFLLAGLSARFLGNHPGVSIEICCDAAMIDIIGSGFDAGVRFHPELAQDMVAIPLGRCQRYAVVASPAVVRRQGPCASPADLDPRHCIRHRFPSGKIFSWTFLRGTVPMTLIPQGGLTVNDAQTAVHAAREGAGFAYVHEEYAAPLLQAGELERVLDEWAPGLGTPYLYFPKQRHMSSALRAFVDFVKGAAATEVPTPA